MTAKTWLAAIGCACSLVAGAMPTQKELKKVEGLVYELMRSDIADFNARKKSATDVAASAVKYADEAQGEASRFLLLKGAFFYRVQAEDYDGAMNVISKLRADIADVPDKTLAKMLSGAIRNIPRKNAVRLYDLHQRLQDRIRFSEEARDLAAKIKAKPSDKSLHTALGRRYALLGEWDKALPEFEAGNGRVAQVAALERKGDAKPGDVADAWWDLAGTDGSDISFACRAHAADFYQTAIADGSLLGLKKTIAEKRVAEAKADGLPDEQIRSGAGAKASARGGRDGRRPKPLAIDMGNGVKLELVGCPAGTFTMGHEGCGPMHTPHKVTISRPFWAGKYLVTREQWNMIMPYRGMSDKERALGGEKAAMHLIARDEADDFCRKMTLKYKASIPNGYVFRLPTLAELEYIHRANSTDPNDPYSKPRELTRFEMRQIAISDDEKREILRSKNIDSKEVDIPVEVGRRKPNAWGIYDCVGNVGQWAFDTVSGKKDKLTNVNDLRWQDAVDPLFWGTSGIEGTSIFYHSYEVRGWGEIRIRYYPNPRVIMCTVGIRLVAAPDLLKERGLVPPDTTAKGK